MTREPPSAAVVGAGIIGSWTALHLAEAGVRTTLIEQSPLQHTRGSSHGLSRAFRFLGDQELDRLDYSLERWRELEAASGETLLVPTGLLNFGSPGDAFLEKHLDVLRSAGRPCEWLENTAIATRFPMLRYPPEWGAAWDPKGSILLAHRCLSAVQARFCKLGGEIVCARVDSVENLQFDQVIVCAGPWTAALVPELADHLRCLSVPVTYWRDTVGRCSVAGGCPILFNARLTGIYALPACEYRDLVKVLFHGGPETSPDTPDPKGLEPYVEKVGRYVKQHLPELDHRRPAILETCRYTMTADSEPILDRLPSGVVVGCGFSGSGFKHSPASGRILAALALDRTESLPDGFRVDRFHLGRLWV